MDLAIRDTLHMCVLLYVVLFCIKVICLRICHCPNANEPPTKDMGKSTCTKPQQNTTPQSVNCIYNPWTHCTHDDVIKWKYFPRYWLFVRGIHRPPVNSSHKGQWRGALVFSFILSWIISWVNYREVGDLRRHRAHYDVIVMLWWINMDK